MIKWSYLLLILTCILVSCKPTQETLDNHAEVTANLREYEEDVFFQENYNDTVLTDYLYLSYEGYRKKYGLKHSDMDYVAKTSQLSISILKANRSIEKAGALRDYIKQIGRIDTSKINLYSFDKIMPIKIVEMDSVQSIDTTSPTYRMMLEYSSDTLKRKE